MKMMTASGQPVLHHVPYDRFVADVEAIALRLGDGDWVPDYIVGIGRGGLVPGTFLSHRTGIAMLSVDYSAKVPDFSDALLARLAAMTAAGDHILLFDDINDSGGTLNRLRAAIAGYGGVAANVRAAVLIDNVRSAARVEYRSRSIDRTIDKLWYVFPWEAVAPDAALVAEAQSVPERLA
jgi:hypoxanthine phosphoribosyltransferase